MADGQTLESLYDGEGLRAGTVQNGKASTFFYYNGELLGEKQEEQANRMILGYGVATSEVSGKAGYHAYHSDEQLSTGYVTNAEQGVENRYTYNAFGEVREKEEHIHNRILYTGQQYDQVTGQYYLRARFYNSVVGRFLQEDEYRGDGLNLYAYCANNPVVYYDPSGYVGDDCPGSNDSVDPKKENSKDINTVNKGKQNATESKVLAGKGKVDNRINEIKESMTDAEKARTTYGEATVKMPDGSQELWVAGAGKDGYVRPEIRGDDKVIKNEREDSTKDNRYNDAEQTIIRETNSKNAEVLSIGATRPVCPACQVVIADNELTDRVVTPLK